MKHNHLRYIGAFTALATAAALGMAGCSSGAGGNQTIDDVAPTHLEGTVSFWHFFTDREADVLQSVIDDFETANPDVKVDVHSGQDDEKLRKSISSGDTIDVGLSYSTDVVGSFCDSGAFRDLGPYIDRDGVDLTQFSDTVRSYTSTTTCAAACRYSPTRTACTSTRTCSRPPATPNRRRRSPSSKTWR